jgi:quercetin dioxygenase-like cupin family protein
MSYPEPRYLGGSGEHSATYRPDGHAPELTYRSGNTVHYLATGATTNGQFGLYRWEMGPAPSGPDPHFHRAISESFYVLTGEVSLYDGSAWRTGKPGDFFHVPEGGLHGFKGANRSSMLLMFSPGAPREDYFETLAGLAEQPLSEEERVEFMLRHDTYWV